jgi:predicted lipoprotein with Yx(FWY)xxD motif
MIRMILALTLTAALGAIGFVAAGALAGNATQSNAMISLRTTTLGKILVNSKGHTFYLFAKDQNGKSSCIGQCAKYWPPLIVRGKPTAGPGVKKSLIRTTKRSNGALQVTYNRHPLYTYVVDTKAGQTHGQRVSAFGAKWYAVSASGKAVVKAPSGTTTTTTTTTSTYPPYP